MLVHANKRVYNAVVDSMAALRVFFPALADADVKVSTVTELMELAQADPGMKAALEYVLAGQYDEGAINVVCNGGAITPDESGPSTLTKIPRV